MEGKMNIISQLTHQATSISIIQGMETYQHAGGESLKGDSGSEALERRASVIREGRERVGKSLTLPRPPYIAQAARSGGALGGSKRRFWMKKKRLR